MTDSSDDHRRPGKNGKDQAQDRQIQQLNDRIDSWEAEERRVHGLLEQGLSQARQGLDRVTATVQRLEDRLKVSSAAGRWLAGIAVTVLSILLGGLLWGLDRGVDAVKDGFRRQEEQLEAAATAAEGANKKIDSWIQEATRWGNELDRNDQRHERMIDRNGDRIERCCKGQRQEE